MQSFASLSTEAKMFQKLSFVNRIDFNLFLLPLFLLFRYEISVAFFFSFFKSIVVFNVM